MATHEATAVTVVAIALIVVASFSAPVGAQVLGPYDLQWFTSAYGNAYPGSWVLFGIAIVASELGYMVNDTINTLEFVAGLHVYNASGLPVGLCQGCQYDEALNVTIPTSQTPDTMLNVSYTFTGTYWDGTPFCSDTNNICGGWGLIPITPNPYALQQQVSTLQSSVATLNQQVSALGSQVASLNGSLGIANTQIASLNGSLGIARLNITSLNSQVSSYQARVASLQHNATELQQQLTAAQNQVLAQKENISSLQELLQSKVELASNQQQNITSLSASLEQVRSNLTSANLSLQNDKVQLANLESLVDSQKATVSTYQSLYLPIGVAVPAILAIAFLVLYVRKRPSTPSAISQ